MNYRIVATLVMLLFVMLFAVQNAAVVELRFLVWELNVPRWLLIFTMLTTGILIGWLLHALAGLRRASSNRGAS